MIDRTVTINNKKYTLWCETEEQFNAKVEALSNIRVEEEDNANDN